MKRKIVRWLLAILAFAVVVFFLLPLTSYRLAIVVWRLPFGWIGFLKRVVPEITVNWNAIGMVILCSVLIVGGIQWLGSWLYAYGCAQNTERQRWRWQWSFSLYATVWLLFIAAMGATGFVHQLAWLMTSKEPLMVEREYRGDLLRKLRNQALALSMSANDANWDLRLTRQKFLDDQQPGSRYSAEAIEDLDILFLPGTNSQLRAAILQYRNPGKREKSGFMVVAQDLKYTEEHYELSEFRRILAQYEQTSSTNSFGNKNEL
jgi:hypothetical protein